MANVRSITPNEPADFTPELGNYKTLQPFRYWCQKVLPLVYDDSLSYYELLCKVIDYLNKTMEDVETLHGDVDALYTAYVKLEKYVNEYFSNLDIQEEINHKLDEMVKDGTLDRILNGYLQVINNYTVSENTLGTFIVNNKYIPGCCFKNGDIIYALSCPTNDYAIKNKTNTGLLRCFNLRTNVEVVGLSKEIEMGHANSICFDGVNVYIVPVWDFSSGVANNAMYIYKYDINFTTKEKIQTPVNFMGCSFDNSVIYFYGYNQTIYTLNSDNTFSIYAQVNVPETIYGLYNQDFSIKDNVVYLSTPQGLLTKFIKTENGFIPKLSMYLNYLDAECNYYLGESEGFEFTSDGHLLHTRYTNLGNLNIGFICEIPNSVTMYNIVNASYSSSNNTYSISDTALNKFKNEKYELKCISEIQCKYEKPSRLNILSDYTENGCVIRNSMIINTPSNVKFTCNNINVFGCELTFGTCNVEFTSTPFINSIRSSIVNITANANITTTVEGDKQIIYIGDSGSMTLLSNKLANITGVKKIGDVEIYNEGIYKGSVYMGIKHDGGLSTNPDGIEGGNFHQFNISFSKAFDRVPYVSANIFTISQNIKMGSCSLSISDVTKSGFTATIYNNSDTRLVPAVQWFAILSPF